MQNMSTNVAIVKPNLNTILDLIAGRLRLHYEISGTPLIYHLGHWRTFRQDAWLPLDKPGLATLRATITEIAKGAGMNRPPRWLMCHLQSDMRFCPPGWKPFQRGNVVLNPPRVPA